MKAVIMAGGEGTRLRPLTCTLPKPMVPILNRPMMEHILNLLKRHHFTQVVSTLWYLPEAVMDYFGDGAAFGLELEYFIEKTPLGTAGSVKNAAHTLRDTFLVVSGDALTDIDLTAAVAFHKRKGAAATLVLTKAENPLSYGVVLTDEGGRITQFLEKPSWSQVFSDTVNTGIYVLEPEVLDLVELGQKVDFSQDLFPQLLRQGAPLYGYVAPGYWSDVGSLQVYSQAQLDCLEGRVQLELPEPQDGGIFLEEGVQIHPSARLEGPVYLGKGCRVGPGAYLGPYTVAGSFSQIDQGASLKRAVLWSGVQVGARSQLRGCICAKGARLGQNTSLFEGAVVGEQVELGALSTLKPGVKIWPGKVISSGSRLTRSVVWGSSGDSSIFTSRGIAGDLRGSLTLEAIVQVGLSCAAFLGEGKRALVTSDPSKTAELAKAALTAGLRGGGVHIQDGGEAPGRLTRFAVQELALDGAFHLAAQEANPQGVLIECWNARGLPLSKGEQRRLESIFLREDYPRLASVQIGDYLKVAGLRKRYVQSLARHYASPVPGFKVGLVVEPEGDPLGELVRDFLLLGGYAPGGAEGGPTIVIQSGAWFLQDAGGRRLSQREWWQGFVRGLKARGREAVALPVNLSDTVVQTAQGAGLQVQFTKLEPRYQMEIASELGNSVVDGDREVFPQFEPLAGIGEWLLALTAQDLPQENHETYLLQAEVPCPWSEKGRVMRRLLENSDPARTLYLDGIKEYQEGGWVLVVPDDDEPVFRLYSEAASEGEAARLIQHYTELIQRYEREEE